MITLEQLRNQNKIDQEEYQYLKWDFSDQDDINVINIYGKTMLWEAISKGKKDKIQLVKKLIKAGADVNIPARGSNESLLHLAVQIHWEKMVKLLIEHDANLDATDQRVILFDSLGAGSEQVKHIKELLKAIFPTAAIYVDDIKRQNDSGAICFAFAIDDIRHSYTAHNYLGKAFSDPVTGLFDYMESKDQDTYPLAFMRTLQSRKLYDSSIYGHSEFVQKYTTREKRYPLGKNKPSWNELKKQYEEHSGFLNKDAPNEKSLNLRIKEKLATMCNLSIAYLLNNIDSQQHFEELTKKFTIDKFKDHQQKTKRLH